MKILKEKKTLINNYEEIELNKLVSSNAFFEELSEIEQILFGPKLFKLKKDSSTKYIELLIMIIVLEIVCLLLLK